MRATELTSIAIGVGGAVAVALQHLVLWIRPLWRAGLIGVQFLSIIGIIGAFAYSSLAYSVSYEDTYAGSIDSFFRYPL